MLTIISNGLPIGLLLLSKSCWFLVHSQTAWSKTATKCGLRIGISFPLLCLTFLHESWSVETTDWVALLPSWDNRDAAEARRRLSTDSKALQSWAAHGWRLSFPVCRADFSPLPYSVSPLINKPQQLSPRPNFCSGHNFGNRKSVKSKKCQIIEKTVLNCKKQGAAVITFER